MVEAGEDLGQAVGVVMGLEVQDAERGRSDTQGERTGAGNRLASLPDQAGGLRTRLGDVGLSEEPAVVDGPGATSEGFNVDDAGDAAVVQQTDSFPTPSRLATASAAAVSDGYSDK